MYYIFGGLVLKDNLLSNELYWISSDRMEWHKQYVEGDKPCPRSHHCTIYDPDEQRLIIFGGQRHVNSILNI